MKNKRASVSILIFVMAVLFIIGLTLFGFYQNLGATKYNFDGVSVVQSFSVQEDLVKFYARQIGEQAIIGAYRRIVADGSYISNPVIKNSNNEFEFMDLNPNLNQKLIDLSAMNFKQKISNAYFKGEVPPFLRDFQEKAKNAQFGIKNNNPFLEIDGLEMSQDSPGSSVVKLDYNYNIYLEFNLQKLGLDSFQNIKTAKDTCSITTDKIACYSSKLPNFNVKIDAKKDFNNPAYDLVNLSSKEIYSLDSTQKKIEVIFVPK